MKTFLDYLEESDFQVVNYRASKNEYSIGYDTDEDEDEQQVHEVVFNSGTSIEIHVPQSHIDNARFDGLIKAWEMEDENGNMILVQLYSANIIKPEGF